ncbi:MAG: 2-hydroxychromene-2-carboxylate isomerase [Rhodospirillaceae bacterium]|jgi:2-hydroxychromene-2-carboxylate isomerase|nr:2-hydroxychromene-2-carboxylate isomerase [Rhodospirillaceae bacterium]MBT5191006.1 2-hydroxychromene-2-carboxylate isomerase [Rhodospirillaceae bacterium]MBT5894511.1 2-hydroxychromene-2-carboxylate isomerase [Rhodospirillaceae bacterium]MBT6429337.1 2-hydroxychromene-2-carboxylate isomerase [Rhodospirillaceae bacterium]MBT7760493.1 2-hydroxychromene-2-carboxylate isomerase [Rhodospirillaceae bacterium]
MASKQIDFYWEIGSTNSYFAWHLIKPIAKRHNAQLNFHAVNLGFVFRHHNYVLMEEPKAKISNRFRDLQRWAQRYDLPFRMPDVFPIKTSRALRATLAMRRWDLEEAYIDALMAAYWEQNDATIAEYSGLRPLAASLGVDPDALEAAAESDDIRQMLIDSTNNALEKGVFGVPSFIVDSELYWGKDRMEFIEDALADG